ncbi:MAG: DUF5666 domain-containing protein [Pseudomonadota bacterium]
MTPLHRRAALGLLGSSFLSGCLPSPVASPAVTRGDPFEGGIGGTGIIGLLTDFGSLIVNGLRVEVLDRTRFATPFGPIAESAVAPGMALTIQGTRSRDRLLADRVTLDHPLIGTVAANGTVNGVPVRTEPGSLGRLDLGRRVAVSGLWTRSGIIASRIDPAEPGPDVIAGVVDRGAPAIGGTAIALPVSPPPAGSYLAVSGRYDGTVLVAQESRAGRFTGTASLTQLSVEGFLEPIARAPDYRIAGLGHSFARGLRLDPLAQQRAIYFGRYDGTFRAGAGYVLPQAFPARRTLLRDGFGPSFAGDVIPTGI